MAEAAQEEQVVRDIDELLAGVLNDDVQVESDLSDDAGPEILLSAETSNQAKEDNIGLNDPTKKDLSTSQFNFKYISIVLAIVLRMLAHFYLKDFLGSSPQLVTPWNSFKRFKEGVFLFESESVDDVYNGDMFHVMPMFIYVLRPSIKSIFWLRLEWAILDLFCAYFMEEFVRFYVISHEDSKTMPNKNTMIRAIRLGNIAFAGYLLNPMTIGCWAVLSLSSIVNALVAAFLLFVIKDHLILSIFSLALATQLNLYYAILLSVVAVRFSCRLWAVLLTSVFSFAFLYGANFAMVKDPWLLFSSTIGFFLTVPDLTPNVGIFWYFFIQIFEHYRLLFLFVFQLNAVIYLIPLAATLRKNSILLAVSLLIFVAIFSSYPSYAETALYLPLIAAFFELHKFFRYGLILGSTLVASLILTPIMWRMWVETGTGNANFFFAIGWVFSLAQIFILADLISAYLRLNVIKNCCEKGVKLTEQKIKEIEDKITRIKLVSASPI